MKVFFSFFAQLASAALLLTPGTQLFSQKTATWKGGAPGMEQEWNCPKNWSGGTIPNEFSNVIIPDVRATTQAAPVIQSGLVEVNALFLESSARLTIGPSAELIIHETAEGLDHNTLNLKGKLLLPEKYQNKVYTKTARQFADKW